MVDHHRGVKVLWSVSAAALGLALLAVLAFVFGTLRARVPYWGEAEVLFEASRIRKGYPLFIDPMVGATESGLPASRYYVTYPPLLSYALSVVPSAAGLVVGRSLACLSWFGALGWMAATARRECRENAIACAVGVAGIWLLANFAMVSRPDSVACALAAVGLTRAIKTRRVDALSIVLLVLSSWVKPTILGLPVGALLADAIVHRRLRGLAIAAVVTGVIGVTLHAVSHGALFDHVVRSNAQPLSLDIWLERVPARLPFFAPLFVLAFWHAIPKRHDAGLAIGIGALGGALAWSLVAIAKTGSAANYWMEPCIAGVALVCQADGPFVFGKSGRWHALVTLAAVLYTDVASIPTAVERVGRYRREAAFVATVRERCEAAPGDVIASDEQGLELALDDRILAPAYQMSWLVAAGKFPAQLWIDDLSRPNVKCFLIHSGALVVAPEVAKAVDTLFAPIATEGDFRLLRRSSSSSRAPPGSR